MKHRRAKRDPSSLPGSYETRVFVGGSYWGEERSLLDQFEKTIREEGFVPIVADQFNAEETQVHDITLYLMHSCRYSVFEASVASGALMEIERTRDYGTKTLVLWQPERIPGGRPSRMLTSYFRHENQLCEGQSYGRVNDAIVKLKRWLQAMKRSGGIYRG